MYERHCYCVGHGFVELLEGVEVLDHELVEGELQGG